jgi:hypothetical protein
MEGGDPGGMFCRILWAVRRLEDMGHLTRSPVPGLHAITPEARMVLATVLRIAGPEGSLVRRYPGLGRLVPSRREPEPWETTGGLGSGDLEAVAPWEGASPLTHSGLAMPLMAAALDLSWDPRSGPRELLAMALRLAGAARHLSGLRPPDPSCPDLDRVFEETAGTLASAGLLHRAGSDTVPFRITDAGRPVALGLDPLRRLLACSAACSGLRPGSGPTGMGADDLLNLERAALELRAGDLAPIARGILATGRAAFRRLGTEVSAAAAARVPGRRSLIPFQDVRAGDGSAAARKVDALRGRMERRGTGCWALLAAGNLHPKVQDAVTAASPRFKAADETRLAELMCALGCGVTPLPRLEFRMPDRAFFDSLTAPRPADTGRKRPGRKPRIVGNGVWETPAGQMVDCEWPLAFSWQPTPAASAGATGNAQPYPADQAGTSGAASSNPADRGDAAGSPSPNSPDQTGADPGAKRRKAMARKETAPEWTHASLFSHEDGTRKPADGTADAGADPESPAPATSSAEDTASASADTECPAPASASSPEAAGTSAGAPEDGTPSATAAETSPEMAASGPGAQEAAAGSEESAAAQAPEAGAQEAAAGSEDGAATPDPNAGSQKAAAGSEDGAAAPDPKAGSQKAAAGHEAHDDDPRPQPRPCDNPEEFLREWSCRMDEIAERELEENVLALGEEPLLKLGRIIADAARRTSPELRVSGLGDWGVSLPGIFPETCPNQHVLPVRARASGLAEAGDLERIVQDMETARVSRAVLFAPLGLDGGAAARAEALSGRIRCLEAKDTARLMLRLGVGTKVFLSVERSLADMDYLAALEE